ncbi:tyrosine-type recombinase/integrase [Parabacteroides sp.]
MKSREKKGILLLDHYFQQQIRYLNESEKRFTAASYRNTMQSVRRFIGESSDCFYLENVTSEWVSDYVSYMQETDHLSAGSANCYFRTLRAVYNKALKQYRIEEPEEYPFKSNTIVVPPTIKRALSKEDVCLLRDAELTGEKARARDIFMFLFYARGMCFVDLFNLKKSDFYGGYINYSRSKTDMPLRVKIIPELQELAERYAEESSPYLFPFLHHNRYKSEKEVSEQSALRQVNRNLRAVGEELKLSIPLTTYVARHTWATLVEACGTATSIISQALGHSSERVTKTYMKGMPSHLIDDTNEEMLNSFIRGKSMKSKKKGKSKNKKCLIPCKNRTSNSYLMKNP